ncbi:hypothetical protein B0T17DRAFT_350101 [Bombardia bombarda]|uniref:Uncharacterized protein n=1 Tax=Bombardia bombarda TaxID=252184 RepID=A0AA40BVV5_9PEZI|nr:hypothetical protein B0T17DRAFT_350101 [Bombardia bombarda]
MKMVWRIKKVGVSSLPLPLFIVVSPLGLFCRELGTSAWIRRGVERPIVEILTHLSEHGSFCFAFLYFLFPFYF